MVFFTNIQGNHIGCLKPYALIFNVLLFFSFLLLYSASNAEDMSHAIFKKHKIAPGHFTYSKPEDSVVFRGRVVDESGKAMPGATIRIKGQAKVTMTNEEGHFEILASRRAILQFTYVSYVNKEISLAGHNPDQELKISLIPGQNLLGEVNIVSTGYQDLPKERATGSFEVISKEQLQHSSDPNLLRRLEGITTSMDFNDQNNVNLGLNNSSFGLTGISGVAMRSPLINLTIRGRNTLVPTSVSGELTGQPLVVIDGIASAYSIDDIDPNDVESITI